MEEKILKNTGSSVKKQQRVHIFSCCKTVGQHFSVQKHETLNRTFVFFSCTWQNTDVFKPTVIKITVLVLVLVLKKIASLQGGTLI